MKDKLLHLSLYSQKRGTILNFEGSVFFIWVCYSDLFTKWPQEAASFEWGLKHQEGV